MGVKEWIEMLASGEIQPEVGDIVKKQVVAAVEYYRGERQNKDCYRGNKSTRVRD